MLTPRSTLTRRIVAALDASPSRIPGPPRRMRQRPHDAAAAAARSARPHRRRSTSTSSARRRRPSGSCARSRRRRRFRSASRAPAGARAAFDATLAFLRRARARRRRAGHVPARRIPRAADVRELSRPAPRAARAGRRPGGQRQPLRADQPLHGAHAAAAARPLVALRSDSHAAADGRRHARHARPGRRPTAPRRRARRASTSRAPCRRSPTAARPTSARSPTSSPPCASTAARRPATRSARSPRCSRPDGRLSRAVPLLLRAAPAPRARLRRAQGDSRDPRRKTKG